MLTAEQKALRRTRIGASEIGSVLGIDKYRTPLQLWMQKRMPRDEGATEDHRSWGLDVEGAILRHYARANGYVLAPSPGSLAHPTLPLVATPDGLGIRNGRARAIQAKNCEEHHAREWGEPGTSEVPLFYFAQVTVELGVLRAQPDEHFEDAGDVAASFGGRPPVGYPIPFSAELFGNLAEAAAKFVRDHLETDRPPPLEGDRAALEYVKRRFREPTGEVLQPTPEAVELAAKLREAKAREGATDAEIEALQAQLCGLIGDAYGIEGICTWGAVKEQRRRVTDWPMVVEHLAMHSGLMPSGYAAHAPTPDELRDLVERYTHEEVVKDSYRRLLLAKERKNGK